MKLERLDESGNFELLIGISSQLNSETEKILLVTGATDECHHIWIRYSTTQNWNELPQNTIPETYRRLHGSNQPNDLPIYISFKERGDPIGKELVI